MAIGAWFAMPQSRITYANFFRIRPGMSEDEVKAILGEAETHYTWPGMTIEQFIVRWSEGPNLAEVGFTSDQVTYRHIHVATTWESLQWYAKKAAKKIGVK
jgi:hypothetical protein